MATQRGLFNSSPSVDLKQFEAPVVQQPLTSIRVQKRDRHPCNIQKQEITTTLEKAGTCSSPPVVLATVSIKQPRCTARQTGAGLTVSSLWMIVEES